MYPDDHNLITYCWLIIVALWGGAVSYAYRISLGAKYSLPRLLGELSTSAFAGVVVMWVCEYYRLPLTLTAAAVGIAGHAGARTLAIIEYLVFKRIAGLISGSINDRVRRRKV